MAKPKLYFKCRKRIEDGDGLDVMHDFTFFEVRGKKKVPVGSATVYKMCYFFNNPYDLRMMIADCTSASAMSFVEESADPDNQDLLNDQILKEAVDKSGYPHSYVHIESLEVNKEFRGKGFGSRILNKLI